MKPIFPALLACLFATVCSHAAQIPNYDQADNTKTTVPPSTEVQGIGATLLSAFFGADNAFPPLANRFICEGAAGSDGMPVVFSHQIDTSSLQAGDFRITRADGSTGSLVCVTPMPALDVGELRTILLIGEYGSAENQPVKVDIVGNLLSIDGSINFRDRSATVIPMEDGPTLIYAEIVPESQWDLGKDQATGRRFGAPGDGCPESTQQVLRVVWTGGVTKPGGNEIDDVERLAYKVSIEDDVGELTTIAPFAVADLRDGDNNHELCLDTTAKPVRVEFPAGLMTDPIEDLNPATSIDVDY
tara:strand:- start:413 stop:1315 length:903 start_codon:yes stop_codon:yes gene_type:complete